MLGESAAWMAGELMEAEVAAQIGAELGERTRSGRPPPRLPARTWDPRVGALELAIPKLRQGSYFPSFLEPRRRAEQALVAVVQEADGSGVSTRRVDRLVEQLGPARHEQGPGVAAGPRPGRAGRLFREGPLEGRSRYLTLLLGSSHAVVATA